MLQKTYLCKGIYLLFMPYIMCSSLSAQWLDLFNGIDLDNWTAKIHRHDAGINYAETFRVEDSIIQIRYDQYEGDFNDQFGHLYFNTPYAHFHLTFEYRFVGELHPGAPSYTLLNSGVMFHSQDPYSMPKEQDWPISVEMQLLAGLDDGKPRPTGNMCSPGSMVDYQGEADNRHCINSSSETYPPEQWVKGALIVYGDSLIQHIIEGDVVLEYTKPRMATGVINRYDSTYFKEGQPLKEGFISLQSEGQPIDFRRIRLKVLR